MWAAGVGDEVQIWGAAEGALVGGASVLPAVIVRGGRGAGVLLYSVVVALIVFLAVEDVGDVGV